MTKLSIFKMHEAVNIPKQMTEGSACFDIEFNNAGKSDFEGYSANNAKFVRRFSENGGLFLAPGDRAMVPTGLVLDIPAGYSVRVHARSGLSLKSGLSLANCEGVIDSDYVEELFVLVINNSNNRVVITNQDRIAQLELVQNEPISIAEIKKKPEQKTSRAGGHGSTGVSKPAKDDVPKGTVFTMKVPKDIIIRGSGSDAAANTILLNETAANTINVAVVDTDVKV